MLLAEPCDHKYLTEAGQKTPEVGMNLKSVGRQASVTGAHKKAERRGCGNPAGYTGNQGCWFGQKREPAKDMGKEESPST